MSERLAVFLKPSMGRRGFERAIRCARFGLGLVVSLSASGQDRAALDEAADRALQAVAPQIGVGRGGVTAIPFFGLACLAEGSTLSGGKRSAEIKKCVDLSMQGWDAPRHENWVLALRALFLSEVYKKEKSEAIKAKLKELLARMAETQETTGGWSHHKGFAYSLDGAKIPDVCAVGALTIAAMGNCKGCGIEPPAGVLERALAYVQKMGGASGLQYGTNNPDPDDACSRGAAVLIGLHFLGQRNGLYDGLARGVRSRFKEIPQAHAFPPLHVFNSAVGNYLLGNFGAWKNYWLPKLLSLREPDGSIWMKDNENTEHERTHLQSNAVGTAVLALICNLDKNHVFQPFPKPERAKGDKPGSRSRRKK